MWQKSKTCNRCGCDIDPETRKKYRNHCKECGNAIRREKYAKTYVKKDKTPTLEVIQQRRARRADWAWERYLADHPGAVRRIKKPKVPKPIKIEKPTYRICRRCRIPKDIKEFRYYKHICLECEAIPKPKTEKEYREIKPKIKKEKIPIPPAIDLPEPRTKTRDVRRGWDSIMEQIKLKLSENERNN